MSQTCQEQASVGSVPRLSTETMGRCCFCYQHASHWPNASADRFPWTPVVLCERERQKGGDAVFGRRILPDAERSRADISLPIHRRTGSSARSQAKTPSAARGYRRSRASKGTATQAGQGGTGGNSGLTGRFRNGPGASRPKQAGAARERRRSPLERLDAARAAMAQRKDVQPEWVITTFGTLVDGLKAATTSPDTSLIPPRSASSDPGPQVNIGILQRLGFVQTGKMLGDELGWSEAWVPEPGRRLFFIIDLKLLDRSEVTGSHRTLD